MAECDSCGAYVTDDFHRVFSDNEGYLDACPECEAVGKMTGETLL